jgi:hypothetical protein
MHTVYMYLCLCNIAIHYRVSGRPVIVDYETGRVKGSFRTTDGRQYGKSTVTETAVPATASSGSSSGYKKPAARPAAAAASATAGLTGKEWRAQMFGHKKRQKTT